MPVMPCADPEKGWMPCMEAPGHSSTVVVVSDIWFVAFNLQRRAKVGHLVRAVKGGVMVEFGGP
jgi:hypothetical protein